MRTRLCLERLEDRTAPAVATWTNGAGDGKWTTVGNWDWDNNAMDGVNHPGDAAGRNSDTAKFTGAGTCTLNAPLAGPIKTLEITAGSTILVSLNVDIVAGTSAAGSEGLKTFGGTVSVGAAKTLTLAANVGHQWAGGIFTGGGTVKVSSSALTVTGSASNFACHLLIRKEPAGAASIVTFTGMTRNLALIGNASSISVGDGCHLRLYNDNTVLQAGLRGGINSIAGGNIEVMAGGTFDRGYAGGPGGEVVVEAPITNEGTLAVHTASVNGQLQRLTLQGNANGYALQTLNGGKVELYESVTIAGPIYFNNATLKATVGGAASTYAAGDVVFGTSGGILEILRSASCTLVSSTSLLVGGDLTLTLATNVKTTWYNDGAGNDYLDGLTVGGTATLAGVLTLSGDGTAQPGWIDLLFATDIVGTFNSIVWPSGGSVNLDQQKVDGLPYDSFQIMWY